MNQTKGKNMSGSENKPFNFIRSEDETTILILLVEVISCIDAMKKFLLQGKMYWCPYIIQCLLQLNNAINQTCVAGRACILTKKLEQN